MCRFYERVTYGVCHLRERTYPKGDNISENCACFLSKKSWDFWTHSSSIIFNLVDVPSGNFTIPSSSSSLWVFSVRWKHLAYSESRRLQQTKKSWHEKARWIINGNCHPQTKQRKSPTNHTCNLSSTSIQLGSINSFIHQFTRFFFFFFFSALVME